MVTLRGEHPEDVRRHAEDWYYARFESVRVAPDVRFVHESPEDAVRRRAAFGDASLTVAETIVDEGGQVLYRFEEVEGEHNAGGFHDALGASHDYGVALVVDGEPWLVPLDPGGGSGDPTCLGAPKRLSLDLDRFGRLNFPHGPGELEAQLRDEPIEGEFDTVPLPDGSFRLRASAWHVDASPGTVALAGDAVMAHRDALGFQP